jgi:hypothetical protein
MRDNFTNEGYIKEFKNNNINVKLSIEALENIARGRWSDIEVLSWLLDSIDTYFIGEEFCLSNFDIGAMLYNCYSDRVYIISFTDIEEILKAGRTLKLYARIPDDSDREQIKEHFEEV